MKADIIAVGTEILLGNIVNTNAAYLSQRLSTLGFDVYYHMAVGDNEGRLTQTLLQCAQRSELLLVTGGLGPTGDDITKEVVAKTFGSKLLLDQVSLERIEEHFRKIGRPMVDSNKKQAYLPEGCRILQNDNGTAPGFILDIGKNKIVVLPGPPREMKLMFERYTVPFLQTLSVDVMVSHTVKVFGIGESAAETMVKEYTSSANPTVAPYAKDGEMEFRVTAKAGDGQSADRACREMADRLCAVLGDAVYGIDVQNLQQAVVERLISRKLKVATAESCTAGYLSKRIADVPGSSQVFEMGLTAYANRIKEQYLKVSPETLEKYGAVSAQTAMEMAVGVRGASGADIGLSVTGIAGPDGGTEEKPVGTVYLALAVDGKVYGRKLSLTYQAADREYIRYVSASNALDMCRRYLDGVIRDSLISHN